MASSAAQGFIGNLMTAFALALGSNERQIGILTSARRLAGFTQLFTNHLLERIGSKRNMYYCVFGTSRTVRLIIALLPTIFFFIASHNLIWCLILLMLLASCADAIGIVLKKTWLSELTPAGIRGRYFGLRDLLAGFCSMLIGYLSSLYVDYWKETGKEMFGFQSLFLFSTLLGYSTLVIITMIPEVSSEPKKQGLRNFLRSFQIPFRDKPFVVWTAFRGCYSFAVGFAGPFFTVYLLKELRLPLATVAIYTAIGQLASIVLSRFWGSLADKYGNITVLMISCIGKSIFPALWIFATGVDTLQAIIWLGFVHCVRGFNSAQKITMLNMTLWLSPEEHRPMYLACESTIASLLSAVSPYLGGLLLGLAAGKHAEISILGWHHTLCAMHILFLISAILRGASSLILIWVKSDSV